MIKYVLILTICEIVFLLFVFSHFLILWLLKIFVCFFIFLLDNFLFYSKVVLVY